MKAILVLLNQVEFNSKKVGGNIDFWGLGWLGVFVWDYEKEEQLINLLIEPSQEEEDCSLQKITKFIIITKSRYSRLCGFKSLE